MTQLYIPTKEKSGDQNRNITIAMRTIERWANSQPAAGGITQITSADGTVTITNPTGPTTDLHVGGTFGGYASLTGSGQTTTPGNLTQAGGFIINDTIAYDGTEGILLQSTNRGAALTSSGRDSSFYGMQISSVWPMSLDTNGPNCQFALTVGAAPYFVAPTGSLTISQWTNSGINIIDAGTGTGSSGGLTLSSRLGVTASGPEFDFQMTNSGGITFNITSSASGTNSLLAVRSSTGSSDFVINGPGVGGSGGLNGNVVITSTSQIRLSSGTNGMSLIDNGPVGSGGISIQSVHNNLMFPGLPTTNPGSPGSGRVWNNGGVLNIT